MSAKDLYNKKIREINDGSMSSISLSRISVIKLMEDYANEKLKVHFSNVMSSRLDREIERFDLEKEDSVWPVHTIRRVLKSIRDGNLISKDK